MKTNGKLIELFRSLEAEVLKGDVKDRVPIFRNIKLIEPIVYPLIEIQKGISKQLEDFQNSVYQLRSKYGEDYGKGYPEVLSFLKKENGELDFSKPNPKCEEYKAELSKLQADNESLFKKHKKEVTDFETLLEEIVSNSDLAKLKFIPIDIEKISNDVNVEPWFEFGVIKI